MPTEQQLRDNPLQQFRVEAEVLWFDADANVFCVAPANSGDAGDAFETYEEAIASLS